MEASSTHIPAAEELPVTFDKSFWKRIPVGVVTPMPANFVLVATKNLCHLLLLQEEATIVMEKAAKLAAQFRIGDKNSDELVINTDKLRQVFDVRPQVRLDLGNDANEQSRLFVQNDFSEKWQNDFVAFVDSLTVAQSVVFGPQFACLLLKLGKLDATEVAKEIHAWMDIEKFGWSVKLEEENFVILLSKYAGAMPEEVLFNTVFGGLVYYVTNENLSSVSRSQFYSTFIRWMAFYGMDLVMIIHEFETVYWLKYQQLIEEHAEPRQKILAQNSWNKLKNFFRQLRGSRNEWEKAVPYWPLARVFDDRVFFDVSYSQNQWFCNLTFYLIDLLKNEAKIEILKKKFQPSALVISRWRSQIGTLSSADIKLARLIFNKMPYLAVRR